MNINLSKGTIANVLIFGIGTVFFFRLIFLGDGFAAVSEPVTYFVGVLFAFYALPWMRIRESKSYLLETKQVIANVESILGVTQNDKRLGRPAYDYFLRAIPNGSGVLERVHDLGTQARLLFAISRLWCVVAAMLPVALAMRAVGNACGSALFDGFVSFAGGSWAAAVATSAAGLLVSTVGAAVFQKRGNAIVRRQRDLERMTILANVETLTAIGETVRKHKARVDSLFLRAAERVPNTPIAP